MGEGFRKFKRKITLNTVFKSILYGLSLGLTVSAVLLIIKKLVFADINAIVYISTGMAAAVVFTLVMFFVLRQSNKKIARRLDRELKLQEKVKTMMDYSGDESVMAQLQREDANKRLKDSPAKGYATRRLWIGIITLLVSAALLVTGILIPQKESPMPYDPDYDMSDFEVASLVALIEHVRASGMTQAAKDSVIEELEDIIDDLSIAEKESQKKDTVITAIKDVQEDVDAQTVYDQIGVAMITTEFQDMQLFNSALNDFVNSQKSESYDELRAKLSGEDTTSPLSTQILRFSNELNASIKDFGGNTNLPLYEALSNLKNGTAILSEKMIDEEYTPEKVQEELDKLFNEARDGFDGSMAYEIANINEGKYVVVELMRIFNISQSDLNGDDASAEEDSTDIDASNPDDNDDDKDFGDGGAGEGDLIYGSNDIIYDPNSDKGTDEENGYVKYGDVFSESDDGATSYSEKMYGMINESNLPDEVKDYIQNYLEMLFNGVQ